MLTEYEEQTLRRLRHWQAEPPSWGTRVLGEPATRVSKAVQAIVPVTALRAALESADKLGQRLADERSILARAAVPTLAELRAQPLPQLDRLAEHVGRRATALAATGGAIFGIAGAFGLIADVPALLTLALRTIHRTGLCYGEHAWGVEQRRLGLGIFALVSANSADEKRDALRALRAQPSTLIDAAWRDGVERVAERELAKEATVYTLQNLARSIGLQLGHRKAAGALPILGAAVGGGVNAWYVRDVALTARHIFQERWLRERYPRFLEDEPPGALPDQRE